MLVSNDSSQNADIPPSNAGGIATDSSAENLLHHVAVFALCHGTLGMTEGEAMKAIRDLIICRVQLPTTMQEFKRSAGCAIQALASARAS